MMQTALKDIQNYIIHNVVCSLHNVVCIVLDAVLNIVCSTVDAVCIDAVWLCEEIMYDFLKVFFAKPDGSSRMLSFPNRHAVQMQIYMAAVDACAFRALELIAFKNQ
jgi:hypothetical protein